MPGWCVTWPFCFTDNSGGGAAKLQHAMVIIEVLSPSTENYDRGFKFEQYRRLTSLQDYVVLAQDRLHVEHSTRQDHDSWILRETSDSKACIHLLAIDCVFSLVDAYESVEFAQDRIADTIK